MQACDDMAMHYCNCDPWNADQDRKRHHILAPDTPHSGSTSSYAPKGRFAGY